MENFLLVPILSDGRWTVFDVKKCFSKIKRKKALLPHFMKTRLSIKHVWKRIRHSKPVASIILADRALVVKLFYKNGESATVALHGERTKGTKIPFFIKRNAEYSTVIWGNGEFEGLSMKAQTILQCGPRLYSTVSWKMLQPRHERTIQNSQFDVFCPEFWICIHTESRLTSY